MVTSFKVQCRRYIERFLDVPATGFFVRNETSIRLCYLKEGQFEYINLATVLEAAIFFRKHGIIDFYSCKGDEVKMFEKKLITVVGDKGQPVQHERLVQVRWQDIELNASQVQTLAAAHEMEINKVVKKFIKDVFKAA